MTEKFILGLSAADAQHAQWLTVDAQGSVGSRVDSGSLASAASAAADRPVIVVLNDMQVTRTHCNLPVSGAKLVRALPYALEDQFAEDVELLHFAAGPANDDGQRAVAVISKADLERCLAQLAEAGIVPAAIYTTHDSLTPLAGFTQLLVSDGGVVLSAADGQLAGLAGVGPDDVLAAWLATQTRADDAAEPVHLRVYCDEAAHERYADDWQRMRDAAGDLDIKLISGWLPFAARAIASGYGINLLQGAYSAKSDALASFRPWLTAAALLLAVVLLGLVNRVVDYRDLSREAAALDAEIAALLARTQRGGGNVSNPEAQLAALLNRQQRGNGGDASAPGVDASFLPTLVVFADAARANQVTDIDAIAYRNGIFDVRLTTPDATTLEALTRQVSGAGGLTARIQRTEQQDNAVKSFVQISQVQP